MPLLGIHFGGDLPYADLSERFGPNLCAGLAAMYKTKSNFVFGLDFNYMFGRNIKEKVLSNLTTEEDKLIDNSGYPAIVNISQRVLNFTLHGGKIWPFFSSNGNSGLITSVGIGYMQHKIHFVDLNQQIAALNGDIRNGYDRLTNGISAFQFVGYIYLSDNRFTNFYAGFESYQGFTKSVRKWNYSTGTYDNKSRIDGLIGFRFGWILPLYSKAPKDYYYY